MFRAIVAARSAPILLSFAIAIAGFGCDRSGPRSGLPTAPSPSPAVPIGPTVAVTGHVTGTAVSLGPVSVAIYPLRLSAPWFGSWGRHAQADAGGRFQILNVPQDGETAYVRAQSPGHVQQCAQAVVLNGDAGVDVTLARPETVLVTGLPRSPATRHVSGIVYEWRDGERRPAAGIWVGWEPMMDTVVADTFTDARGRYHLCGLPPARLDQLFATRPVPGSGSPAYFSAEAGGDVTVDLELP